MDALGQVLQGGRTAPLPTFRSSYWALGERKPVQYCSEGTDCSGRRGTRL